MVKLLYWTVMIQIVQNVFGVVSEDWMWTFVNGPELEGEPGYPASSVILCSVYASQIEEGNLICMIGNKCIISNLKKGPHRSAEGMNDPVQCLTKFDSYKEECTSGPVPKCGIECCTKTPSEMKWPEAREYCQSLGMDLLTRPYLETVEQCAQILDTFKIDYFYWIGAWNPGMKVDTVKWIDGTSLPNDDTRWSPGTPQGGEEYVHMKPNHRLDDYPGSYSIIAMCGYRLFN